MKTKILITFGGESPEHEVSIITALQAIENIDNKRYEIYPIYQNTQKQFFHLKNLTKRTQFLTAQREKVTFGKDEKGGYFQENKILGQKIYPKVALLCYHGGEGESGSMAGFFETLSIPITSSDKESSTICMNKSLTKKILLGTIPQIDSYTTRSYEIRKNSQTITNEILKKISLPLIIKPVHLGSSIGIKIAKSEIELEKKLIEAANLDDEILIEKFLDEIEEYNIAAFKYKDEIKLSEIERPKKKDEILSFKDKYQNGARKNSSAGMASLDREIPAKITVELKKEIQEIATQVYLKLNCHGVVRIDFIYHQGKLYFNEINPIPGSLSFYLWEPLGIQFSELLDMILENAIWHYENRKNIKFESTDIVQKFILN